MWGIFGKPLKRAVWNPQVCILYRRHARDLRPFWTMLVLLLAYFCQHEATMSAYKFTPFAAYKSTPRAVASPDATQKPLVQKRAPSGGANWGARYL